MCYLIAIALALVFLVYYAVRRVFDSIRIKDIHKKYVLITGCDTGFGYAASLKFDKLGCYVVAGCYTDEGKTKVKEECSSRLQALRLDVCSDASVNQFASLVRQIVPEDEGLWAIVNNAGGIGAVGPMEWYQTRDLVDTLNLNLFGMMRVTNALLPLLKRGGGGRIVNTASVLGYISLPYVAAYSISKHAVVAFSHALRREVSGFGITVHMILPGGHRTPFLSRSVMTQRATQAYNHLTPTVRDHYGPAFLKKMLWSGTELTYGLATATPDGVVGAYEKALFSKYPRLHYVIGWDSMAYLTAAYLPDWLCDLLFKLPFFAQVPAASRH